MYIYNHNKWPELLWKTDELIELLSEVRHLQGKLIGKLDALGFDLKNEAHLESLSQDVIKSSEIEGEILDNHQVRSSIARRLGIEIGGLVDSDRNVDGVVEMMIDATQNYDQPLTQDRLFGWHSSLFPSGRSGMHKIIIGDWRDDSTGPMQVVSGPMGRERVHFQAPPYNRVQEEMEKFLNWFNSDNNEDLVLKAAKAHLWFVTIHPFEDGNGRIARAISDLLLSRAEGQPQKFYSMSAQIRNERKAYYDILEKTQKGDNDITQWMKWFLNCLINALGNSESTVRKVTDKHQFWTRHQNTPFNPRQIKILNRLFYDFFGKLTTSKWAKINKCSQDTALRDIQDLMKKNVLQKQPGGGRSTSYEVIIPKE